LPIRAIAPIAADRNRQAVQTTVDVNVQPKAMLPTIATRTVAPNADVPSTITGQSIRSEAVGSTPWRTVIRNISVQM